jgi:hypothetical protein
MKRYGGVDRFNVGLGWFWASTRAATWAASWIAEVHQVISLSSSIYYFLFCFYFLV